ncbi:MAG: DUF2520 domain-containing protein [Planctomycetota bacterium]
MTLEIGIVGSGAVATALARALGRDSAACSVRLFARDAESAQRIAASASARAVPSLDELASTDAILVAVTDDAIGEVSAALRAVRPGGAVFHTSGALSGAAAMGALIGVPRGSLHPLLAVPRDAGPDAFEGAPFVVEAETPDAVDLGESIVERLGGTLVRLPDAGDPSAKARYHALATMVASGVVALVDRASGELATSDDERATLRRAFAQLAASAAANVERSDGPSALTGPIARDDASTLSLHADALAGRDVHALYEAVRRAAEAMLGEERN